MSDRLQDEHEPVAEEEAHGLQVDGRARHQLAGLLVVEEAELEPLQVAVQQLAQVVLDAERHAPGDHPPPVGEPPAHEHDARRSRSDQHQQRVAVVLRVRARAVVVLAAPVLIASTARPVRAGSATVITIARLASTQETPAPRL